MEICIMPVTLSSLGAKTMRRLTLTSGTSWTVPAGVTFVNVTLYGGGGGGSGGGNNANNGNTGGNTTFTGATTALGGLGGTKGGRDDDTNGQSANANTGLGGQTAYYTESGSGQFIGGDGFIGDIVRSTLSTTPGATISYAIGAGGTGGTGTLITGGTGGSGKIEVEYWV
jgi:hypothetical protein